MSKGFVTFYPGVYTQREKPCLKRFLEEDDAIRTRGPISGREIRDGLISEELPGVFLTQAEEQMVKYVNKKYDPEDPVYNDEEYAKALGYPALPALPTYAAHDDTWLKPFPAEARDYLLVSGLAHKITFHAPICVGDTLYLVVDDRHLTDVTPKEGSQFRSLCINGVGSIYNQRGELVNTVSFSAQENLKSYADPADKPEDAHFWIAPPWDEKRPPTTIPMRTGRKSSISGSTRCATDPTPPIGRTCPSASVRRTPWMAGGRLHRAGVPLWNGHRRHPHPAP